MKIDIFSLTEGENSFQFEVDLTLVDLPTELESEMPLKVNAGVTKRGTNLIIKGDVTYPLSLECNRCLELFQHNLQAPLEAYFVLGENVPERKEDGEVIRISHTDQSLDLIEIIREAILLAVPYKALCRADCKGLCSVCGRNLNQEQCDCITRSPDPRWAVLKDFQR
ncbi:MAG: DUF177 domain-containing protein [Gemmatimonadota bacterium]|nr:MAG: DUF177 domain-containing protein [Gemmatimonadota bacterium]